MAPRFGGDVRDAGFELAGQRVRLRGLADEGAQGADHGEDAGEVTLVEQVDGEAGAGEIGDDRALDVGEREHQIRFQRGDLPDVRRCEGRDARFFATHLGRADGIARDADDAVLLAEEVEGFYGLLGQADDAFGRVAPQAPDQAEAVVAAGWAGFTSARATATRWMRRKPA